MRKFCPVCERLLDFDPYYNAWFCTACDYRKYIELGGEKMVKVIKDNTIQFRTICECCGSELEYSQGDIFELSFSYDHNGGVTFVDGKPSVVTCPVCDRNTTVPKYVVSQ